MTHRDVLTRARKLIPPLTSHLHKGSSGRIAVVGGSFEYTGAPFYAAISTLKVGADLSFIFCAEAAGLPIKSYSPELMVLPCLDTDIDRAVERLPSIHALVVGPGLGRDLKTFENVKSLLFAAIAQKKQIILDGDALFLLTKDVELRAKLKDARAVLTPNKVEFSRLYNAVFNTQCVMQKIPSSIETHWKDAASIGEGHFAANAVKLAQALEVTVFQKGAVDIITDGKVIAINEKHGSNRRCGGQGDVLAGSLGVFQGWSDIVAPNEEHASVLAGFAVSNLVRKANELAFARKKRSLVTPDIIEDLGLAFEELFASL